MDIDGVDLAISASTCLKMESVKATCLLLVSPQSERLPTIGG